MTLEKSRLLDQEDPLASFKSKFLIPNNTIYLDGNSLGPILKETQDLLKHSIDEEWGNKLIRGWNEHWLDRQKRVATSIAQLINAKPNEVVVTDSVSVNFYKLVLGAINSFKKKKRILTDDLNFPSDIYVLDQLANNNDNIVELEVLIQTEDVDFSKSIIESLNEQIGVLTLSHVTFKDAYHYDEKAINKRCREVGVMNLWDLSHSVGSVDIDVKEQKIDMAVGCTYKFLNGGPGAPAFLYVSEEIQHKVDNPIAGWFSHSNPFDFDLKYKAHENSEKYLVGTSPMLSLTGIEKGVDLFNRVGMPPIVEKREKMLTFFFSAYEKDLRPLGFQLSVPERHGSHLALKHEEAYRINLALINPRGKESVIITDHRPPNIIRIALTPLYVSFEDLYLTVKRLGNIVTTKEYTSHNPEKIGVI